MLPTRQLHNKQVVKQLVCLVTRSKSSSSPRHELVDTTNNIIRSPFSDVQLSDLSLTQYVFRKVNRWTNLPALTDAVTGRSYTFGEARDATERLSITLLEQTGLKPGDVVSIVMPNSPEFALVFFGASAAGLVISAANPAYTAEELSRQLADSGAQLVVTIPALLEKVQAALEKAQGGGQVIVATNGSDAEETALAAKHPELLSLHRLLKREPSRRGTNPAPDPDSVAALPYSSGTTGLPKGVRITHRNLVANMCQMEHPGMLPPDIGIQDVALGILPFFHIYGMNGVMNVNVSLGRHTVTLPRFDPALFLASFAKYSPTQMSIVPPILAFLASTDKIAPENLSRLRSLVSGAAAATTPVIKGFFKKINNQDCDFRQGYGMTETSCVSIFTPPNCDMSKIGAAGTPISLTEIKIVDSEGNSLPQGQTGELLIRGPQVMQGYHNNDTATKETLTDDGWIRTGDVAYVDEESYVFIVDRIKELIKVKGFQVSPTELEGLIRKVAGVADVAVVGVPDERSGELPRAYVVRAPNSNITENDVSGFVESRVAPFKNLTGGVKFVDAIPKNAAGKIDRKIIREWN